MERMTAQADTVASCIAVFKFANAEKLCLGSGSEQHEGQI